MKLSEYKKLKRYEIIYYRGFISLPFYVVELIKKKKKIKATIKKGGIVVEFSYKEFEIRGKYNVKDSKK